MTKKLDLDIELNSRINEFIDKFNLNKSDKQIESILTNNFIEKEGYLFERKGFYSSPKTTDLINNLLKNQ